MRSSKPAIVLIVVAVIMLLLAACASTPVPSQSAQPTSVPATAAEPTAAAADTPTEAPTLPPTETTTAAPTGAPTAAPPGGVRVFVIDPSGTEASYEVDEEFFGGALARFGIGAGQVKTTGATNQVSGQFSLDFGSAVPQLVTAEFTVDISTLKSDQARRDNAIRRDWLQSSRYPTATFRATALQGAPASYGDGETVSFQLAGDLTVRNISKPVVLEVTATMAGSTVSGEAQTQFKMSEFGVEPPALANLFRVGDDTLIRIKFVAAEQ